MDNEPIMDFYRKEDDIDDKRDDGNDNLLLRNDIESFISEEMSEPDIMFWCKDSESATKLLKRCIKLMNEKNWKTMKIIINEMSIIYII